MMMIIIIIIIIIVPSSRIVGVKQNIKPSVSVFSDLYSLVNLFSWAQILRYDVIGLAYLITYLRINLKTIDLSVNLSPVVLKRPKGDRRLCLKTGLKIVVNVL